MQMMMGMLNPNQKQAIDMFKGKTTQEQAEQIASKCNELGISKEQFTQIVTMLSKKWFIHCIDRKEDLCKV